MSVAAPADPACRPQLPLLPPPAAHSCPRLLPTAAPVSTNLQVVVVAAEVSSDVVLDEQRTDPLQQTLCGAVLRDGPHRIVARHQQEVRLGARQPLLQPDQLAIGLHLQHGPSGLLVLVIQRVSTQHHGVQHDDAQSLPRVGNAKVQLVVIRGELPDGVKVNTSS